MGAASISLQAPSFRIPLRQQDGELVFPGACNRAAYPRRLGQAGCGFLQKFVSFQVTESLVDLPEARDPQVQKGERTALLLHLGNALFQALA